jgi:hypothetical protein
MSSREMLILILVLLVLVAAFVAGFALVLVGRHFTSQFLINLGLASIVLSGFFVALAGSVTVLTTMGSIRPSGPSWAAMRPAVQELVTFRHSPQAIAADWRRLRKGHPLTQDQFMQVLRWVYHEKEVRDQRVVARLTKNPALARAHPPAGK